MRSICVVSLVGVLLGCTGPALAQPPAAWLDAREVGASGSSYTTTAVTAAGSNQVTVQDPGDFRPGQGVMISRCNVHVSHAQGSWVVYVFDVDGTDPPTFRWTDDLGRTWKGAHTPVTGDWQALDHGLEVRFKPFAWNDRYSAVIAWRDQLITTIESIDGKVLTLKAPANRTAADAVVRHNDGVALQAGIDRAIAEKRNLFIQPGRYRIAKTLVAADAGGLTVQGANAVDTVIDIGEGEGPCFQLRNGTEVNLRDLALTGNSGYADRDQCGWLRTEGGTALWGMYFRFSAALNVNGTEHVLVENCHARKMSGECFYSQGPGRMGTQPEPPHYTRSITYLRCSVEDCGRNAFNNNDYAENTSVLQCRVRDVGGCTWEGPGRFVHFVGNYVRNGGVVAVGNAFNRLPEFEELPSGQTIVADNTFEDGVNYGACAVRAGCGATQVVIRNNLFVNYGTHAIDISGAAGTGYLPAGQALITGNLIDLTPSPAYDQVRTGITVTGSDVTVSQNQVYVRGEVNPRTTGIRLGEPAVNLTVHDNLIRNCGTGLAVARARSTVAAVLDARTFGVTRADIPRERRRSHRYRGWYLVWLQGSAGAGRSVIEAFDPEQCTFHLTEDRAVKVGDAFEVYPPGGSNWSIHDNT
ncbi:MAG: right-handed parallel beta-helix repeat-containing protein, partial [Armatimonadetes bacterium]|nr:right-handed parallel beta-helix repeat-containing protein [Armatimonadota bacterium]